MRTWHIAAWIFLACVPSLGVAAEAYSTLDDVGSDARGATQVNVAAGVSNAQANLGAVAVGPLSRAAARADQGRAPLGRGPEEARAGIVGNSFANAAGLISVNQASGSANAQANLTAISFGIDGVAATERGLSETSGSGAGSGPVGTDRVREATVEDTTFTGARGLVQVNQAAGAGNATANSFALRVDANALGRQ